MLYQLSYGTLCRSAKVVQISIIPKIVIFVETEKLDLQQYMATTADFKNGLCIEYNGKPCAIVWFQHVKPGKGAAFVKAKLRNLENGRILENTFSAGERVDIINVERRPYQFIYKDDMGFNFMHTETFEQISIEESLIENADLMKEGQGVEMMFLADEERVLTCELPPFVDMEVTYTEPAVKGDTASTNALKAATIETGAEIMVPLFINQGERIRVDTRTRSYAERSK
ncbi:MAG: elongation factor P [Bacteroidales bacterium]